MEPYRERQGLSKALSDKLAKRPLLLIVLTASLSFGVQLIPFQTVSKSLLKTLKPLSQASTFHLKLLSLKEASQPLVTPPILLAFVCLAIFYIAYSSEQEKGEFMLEDQSSSMLEPKRGLLSRTSTFGKSIVAHLLSYAEDEHILASADATLFFDHETTLYNQENDILVSDFDKTLTTRVDKQCVTSDAEEKPKQVVKKSGSKTKLSSPAISTALTSKDQFILDRKLDNYQRSFRENPLKIHTEELNGRFEAYLGNFRRQLELQRQESLTEKKFDLKLKNSNCDPKQNKEPSALVSSFPLKDANFEDGIKQRVSEPQVIADLNEAKLNERIDTLLSSLENRSRREVPKAPTVPHHRKWHSNSYTTQGSVDSVAKETFTPDSKHSSHIIRGDSMTIDNEKFDSFLQKFHNELKLQKQKSDLRQYLHLAHEI